MDIHARREFPEPVRALILLRLVGVGGGADNFYSSSVISFCKLYA